MKSLLPLVGDGAIVAADSPETIVGTVIRDELAELPYANPYTQWVIRLLRKKLTRRKYKMIREKWQLHKGKPHWMPKPDPDDDIAFSRKMTKRKTLENVP